MANNELYLTKGEAKAVREGSDTVDMTDNQMKAMGRRGFGGSSSGLKELIMRLLGGMGSKASSKLSGIAELIEQARDVTGDNKMVGEEVLTEGTTYDFDIDGNPTTFSFTESLSEDGRMKQAFEAHSRGEMSDEEFMEITGVNPPKVPTDISNKNGGIMKFAPGGNPHLDMSEEAAFEAFSSKPSPSPSSYNTGPSNPFNDNNNTINTSPSSSTTNQNNQTQYNQIVDSAGTGNINMQEIVDFREKSGMDGAEYSEFLDKIKKRSGNEAFYDAGFVKGPGEMVQNWIKSGGFLGNILKTVLQGGKDAGVAALDKVTDFKEYLSNFGDGVMANQAVEEFAEVQEPITGYEDSSDVFKLPQNYKFSDSNYMGSNLSMDPNKGFYIAGNPNPTYFNLPQIEQGSYDDSAINPNFYGGRSPTDEMYANVFTMNPRDPNSFPMSRQYNQMFMDNMLSDGGGLFPQMTPQDPLMNSFNKTPLSVLERDNGGVTRQQYMQQYAPKTAAQMLGIVDTYDEEGIMGV